MKKYIMALAVAMIANCMTVSADNVMTVNDITAENDKANVEVCMTNDKEITSWQFNMVLPEGFTVAPDPDDEDYLFVELATDRTTAKKHNTFDASILKSGELLVTCASSTNKTYAVGNGPVCYVHLNIAPSVKAGEYTISLKDAVLTDASDNSSIKPGDVTFTVTVGSPTGIDGVGGNVSQGQFFNLSGISASTAKKGINIVRHNNGMKKVIVK